MAERWKTPEELKRLTVTDKVLGEGVNGIVYFGKMAFIGSKPRGVAVKIYRKPLTEREVGQFEDAIAKMRFSDVPLPKVAFIKHKGKWAQVMELFGAKEKGSKIKHWWHSDLNDKETRAKLMQVLARIADSGHLPAVDSIGYMQTSRGPRFIVHDLDAYGKPTHISNLLTPVQAVREWAHYLNESARRVGWLPLLEEMEHSAWKELRDSAMYYPYGGNAWTEALYSEIERLKEAKRRNE